MGFKEADVGGMRMLVMRVMNLSMLALPVLMFMIARFGQVGRKSPKALNAPAASGAPRAL